jgi:hypothetical protein
VAVGNEDVAVLSDGNVGRAAEQVVAATGDARLAERHQELAVRTEFEDLVALALRHHRVGYPDVAVPIDSDAVGLHEHAVAEALHHVAGPIESEDRRIRAVERPDVAIGRGIGALASGPFRPGRQLRPVRNLVVWGRQLLVLSAHVRRNDRKDADDSDKR